MHPLNRTRSLLKYLRVDYAHRLIKRGGGRNLNPPPLPVAIAQKIVGKDRVKEQEVSSDHELEVGQSPP